MNVCIYNKLSVKQSAVQRKKVHETFCCNLFHTVIYHVRLLHQMD